MYKIGTRIQKKGPRYNTTNGQQRQQTKQQHNQIRKTRKKATSKTANKNAAAALIEDKTHIFNIETWEN
jgi:hypothetical protein